MEQYFKRSLSPLPSVNPGKSVIFFFSVPKVYKALKLAWNYVVLSFSLRERHC